MSECIVCGYPTFRPDGHAEWCAEVRAENASWPFTRYTLCQLDGCRNPHKARGLCHKHYQRWLAQSKKDAA